MFLLRYKEFVYTRSPTQTALKINLRNSGAERKYHNSERTTLQAMAAAEGVELKRKADNNADGDGDAEDDEWVGPMPSEATQTKKRKGLFGHLNTTLYLLNRWLQLHNANHANETKLGPSVFLFCFFLVLEFERVYLDNLPSAAMYERSYMHRDVITHIVCTK